MERQQWYFGVRGHALAEAGMKQPLPEPTARNKQGQHVDIFFLDKFIQSYQAANDAQKGMKRKTLEMPSPKKPIDKKGEQSSEDQPAAPEIGRAHV